MIDMVSTNVRVSASVNIIDEASLIDQILEQAETASGPQFPSDRAPLSETDLLLARS